MSARRATDAVSAWLFRALAFGAAGLAAVVLVALWLKSRPLLAHQSLGSLLWSSDWQPHAGSFGFLPYLAGTIAVTGVAMVMAVPVSVLAAIYLAEYATNRLRSAVKPLIDLLAAIPSVVYGMWGVVVIVPAVKHIAASFGVSCTGYSLLAAGVVLAVMVFPFLVSIIADVLHAVPLDAREAALALGATRWETTWHIVLKHAAPGIMAAIVLSFSRAFGETMAVVMVAGNVAAIPRSLFAPVYPLPALIANNYGEMMSIPLYDAALMFAALALFVVVTLFNTAAHVVLHQLERRWR